MFSTINRNNIKKPFMPIQNLNNCFVFNIFVTYYPSKYQFKFTLTLGAHSPDCSKTCPNKDVIGG